MPLTFCPQISHVRVSTTSGSRRFQSALIFCDFQKQSASRDDREAKVKGDSREVVKFAVHDQRKWNVLWERKKTKENQNELI